MLEESSDGILSKVPRFDSSVRASADDNNNPWSPTVGSTRGGAWDKQLATSSRTINSSFSPTSKSPWVFDFNDHSDPSNSYYGRLMGSLVREEGHIYSLAAMEDLLYTGSDSKNIRVWKNKKEFSGFKANSGLVKSIVISGGARIFTGHQDGRIRVWKTSKKDVSIYKKIGTLPTMKALIKSSMRPSSFMETRRNTRVPWIKHFDAISSLSLSEDQTILYSASWDRTVKVWRVSNFKCLESISAHDDAVNAVVSGFDGLVFTGSADGSVKVWRRETQGKGTKHFFSQALLKQECAVTALAVDPSGTVVYCGSSDGVVYYWERGNFSGAYGRLSSHKLAVLCLSTAGSLVLSGSADMNICIWKRVDAGSAGHVFLSTLTGHNGPVKCLAVERDREATVGEPRWILYSGSLDKSVKIWQILEHFPMEPFAGAEDPTAIWSYEL